MKVRSVHFKSLVSIQSTTADLIPDMTKAGTRRMTEDRFRVNVIAKIRLGGGGTAGAGAGGGGAGGG
jgi:hypothetical protein